MFDLDGTDNKGKLGANAILAVSMATCKVPRYACILVVTFRFVNLETVPFTQHAVIHVLRSTAQYAVSGSPIAYPNMCEQAPLPVCSVQHHARQS